MLNLGHLYPYPSFRLTDRNLAVMMKLGWTLFSYAWKSSFGTTQLAAKLFFLV